MQKQYKLIDVDSPRINYTEKCLNKYIIFNESMTATATTTATKNYINIYYYNKLIYASITESLVCD